jgi:uncharacterized protein GlcG (DUF336 family)
MKARAIVLAVAIASPGAALAQNIVAEAALSADAALEVAAGALIQCRKEGQKVSVTVVDQAGRPKVSIRDDGAAPHTVEHSLRKAYTALTYRMPSADYGKRVAESKGGIGPQLLANVTSAAGGVPIKAGSSTIGAVGVSGTPSSAGGGEGDAKCAEAGIARIAKDLAPR